jgi:spore coat protein U-like protein
MTGSAGVALAGTAQTIMTVSATIGASCSIQTVTNVAFGTYTPTTESDATGVFTLNCTNGAPVTVTISAGNGSGHSQLGDTRAMVSGANFLSYDLYQDATHTTVWGGTLATGLATTGNGNTVQFNVFGRIRGNLTGPFANGNYSDSVNIVANF